MPKNKGSGGKKKRRGKNEADEDDKRELRYKLEKGEEYALVLRRLGDSRFEAMCMDGTNRLCHIPGKMRKKVWVDADDIVLVGLRDYQDGKADVIHKYTSNEARRLKAFGQLPNNMRLNRGIHDDDDDDDDDGAGIDDDEFEDLDIDKI